MTQGIFTNSSGVLLRKIFCFINPSKLLIHQDFQLELWFAKVIKNLIYQMA